MDAMQYWKKHGKTHVMKMCVAAGTSYGYWKHIANMRKRPSVDLALKFVELSGGELSFVELLPSRKDMRITTPSLTKKVAKNKNKKAS